MSVEQLITVISCIVGIGGFFVAFFVMWSNKQKDVKSETKEQVEVHASLQSQIDTTNNTMIARLDAIDSGVRDIKAEYRNIRTELNDTRKEIRKDISDLRTELKEDVDEVREKAQHAVELAEAAHRRLDRAGIDADQ